MSSSQSSRAPLSPHQFRYDVLHWLGQGGLGVVDVVRVTESTSLELPVGHLLARKRLGPKWAQDETARERFEREIQYMNMMDHPSIVPLRGVSLPGGERAYFMPLYARSLRGYMQTLSAPRPYREILVFVAGIADALHHAHLKGRVHRDIKPENLLLDAANRVYVSDWGVGGFIHKHSLVLDLTHGPLGTAYYASVEQWATGEGKAPADIYALGMTLAELLMGRPVAMSVPGLGVRENVLVGSPVAVQITAFVRQMTAINAGARPASMAWVATRLRQLAAM